MISLCSIAANVTLIHFDERGTRIDVCAVVAMLYYSTQCLPSVSYHIKLHRILAWFVCIVYIVIVNGQLGWAISIRFDADRYSQQKVVLLYVFKIRRFFYKIHFLIITAPTFSLKLFFITISFRALLDAL